MKKLGRVPAFSYVIGERVMNIKEIDILQEIQDAEMVLVGLGEEFDDLKVLKQIPGYSEERNKMVEAGSEWMIPALNNFYEKERVEVFEALSKFAELIASKNYFVVSVSTNDMIRKVPWKEDRLVMPCGGSVLKQCLNGCETELVEVTDDDRSAMEACIGKDIDVPKDLGLCPQCKSPMVLNNIYTEKYDENGYLDMWKIYTKWLQGTLNRKLLILELGVGMQCPTVIRWPFEKVAFYNQKATFCRVNESLYQLTEEIKEKGVSISQNAIDWLRFLC